jgi:hypothetical protein
LRSVEFQTFLGVIFAALLVLTAVGIGIWLISEYSYLIVMGVIVLAVIAVLWLIWAGLRFLNVI